MTREDKNLLLKDLCARLPYGVKCRYHHIQDIINSKIIDISMFGRVNIDGHIKDVCDIKPYLFPLSSMTEEQKKEYWSLVWFDGLSAGWNRDDAVILNEVEMLIDFYHKNHLDWRGVIEKGLAIDATGLNIY